jgi:ribonuclease R
MKQQMKGKKPGNRTPNKLTAKELEQQILLLFQREPKKRYNPKQIGTKLRLENSKDAIMYALEQLAAKKLIIQLEDFKYKLRGISGGLLSQKTLEGRVDMTRTGAAYVVIEGQEEDVFVAAKNMNTALNGDKVKIRAWVPRGRRRAEGEVLEVLERSRDHFMGTLYIYPRYAVVACDGHTPMEIMVDLNELKGGIDNDRVVVRITNWTNGEYQQPLGVVTYVLGQAGSHDIEMKAILINHGFNLQFPDAVLEESESLSTEITEEEIGRRRDMRAITTFTIDPYNAKDFDDALSIRYLENGNLEVGVHIADVTHYVAENSALDKEALDRSTSVYLVDRVLPMLPEKLSNELCSLRPHEDKLTFSSIFTFDQDQKIVERWFGKTIIHSDRRFTYEEAQEILESGEGDFAAELIQLNKMALKLRKARYKNGAINFDSEEVMFRLDEQGVPVEVFAKERKEAHMLIEDFMLLANKEVATLISQRGIKESMEIPFVYRIHDEPNQDKVEELARFAREMGIIMKVDTPKDIAKSFNKLAEMAEEDEALSILGPIAIRTMAKAAYSSENIGHYGLAFDNYTHFTSPIRRYSDVLCHRILEKNLQATLRVNKARLEEMCGHISKKERKAIEAERESIKYKQVEFMEKHVGDVFPGFISGFNERGMFVELKGNHCEGMVAYETMNEPYELETGRLRIRGAYSGKEYMMGQEIQVRIVRTDLSRRQIDMAWVEQDVTVVNDYKKGR